MSWSWDVGTDVDEIHELLLACDAHQAKASGTRAPVRQFARTARHVEAGEVHVLRSGAQAIGMFTLTWQPAFEADLSMFPTARKPVYLKRLAVDPTWLANGSLAGVQCLRRAVELAIAAGADVIRSEANPDLTAAVVLLRVVGFQTYGTAQSPDGARRIYLQKSLASVAANPLNVRRES